MSQALACKVKFVTARQRESRHLAACFPANCFNFLLAYLISLTYLSFGITFFRCSIFAMSPSCGQCFNVE